MKSNPNFFLDLVHIKKYGLMEDKRNLKIHFNDRI